MQDQHWNGNTEIYLFGQTERVTARDSVCLFAKVVIDSKSSDVFDRQRSVYLVIVGEGETICTLYEVSSSSLCSLGSGL